MMLWEWLAVLIAGVAGAGLVLGCAALFKRSALKRLAPACAGVCMLVTVIAGEYLWVDHIKASLPANAQVVQEFGERSPFKPWTWFVSPVQRLSAVAPVTDRYSPIMLVELYLLARWRAPVKTRQWFDCEQARRANSPLADGALPPSGREAWVALDSTDAYLQIACQGVRFLPLR